MEGYPDPPELRGISKNLNIFVFLLIKIYNKNKSPKNL
jgi:hypothetical protein